MFCWYYWHKLPSSFVLKIVKTNTWQHQILLLLIMSSFAFCAQLTVKTLQIWLSPTDMQWKLYRRMARWMITSCSPFTSYWMHSVKWGKELFIACIPHSAAWHIDVASLNICISSAVFALLGFWADQITDSCVLANAESITHLPPFLSWLATSNW